MVRATGSVERRGAHTELKVRGGSDVKVTIKMRVSVGLG